MPAGSSIIVCGKRYDIGNKVVTFEDDPAFNAYTPHRTDDPKQIAPFQPAKGMEGAVMRYRPRRLIGADRSIDSLRKVIRQFVLHHDGCMDSKMCFHVLHNERGLSVHFLIDNDGTIYQTLDLRHKAHHATTANDVSVGVEIAHPGTFPQPLSADMRRWYERDAQGWRMKFPAWMQETGVRTPGFVPRPDRPEMVEGRIHGKQYWQFDYTPQQYRSLAALCAALSRTFPRIRLEAPRDATGAVRSDQLSEAELRAFDGIIGHHHVQKNKTDPGPAMQWDRVLRDARALR